MCGLFGIIGKAERELLPKAVQTMNHRGPDDNGIFHYNNVFFAHTRLSIQDLSSAGAQPITSEDGRYTLIYNGEIYNHLELRKTLTPGLFYNGHSDTETLLKAWQFHGQSILPHLNGFFAFAIYDKEAQTLVLARDRFGIKPLYYYTSSSTIAFTSELKAIKNISEHNKAIDFSALSDYLTLLYATGDKTPFQNIKKLLPGHFLEINAKTIRVKKLQSFASPTTSSLYNLQSENQWKEELENYLLNAVKRQLLSDVSIGYFLSGGLDSSSLVALARNQLGKVAPIEVFTLDSCGLSKKEGFAEDIHYAKQVAQHLNIKLNVIPGTLNLLNSFDKMIWQLDEPMADAAALNVNIICKTAREMGYKVLMSGTGADELFGGYRRHQALNMEPILANMPGPLKRGLTKLGGFLPGTNATLRRSKKLLNAFALDKQERLISYHDWLNFSSVIELFNNDIASELKNSYHPHTYFRKLVNENGPFSNDLELMLSLERSTYLPDNGLLYTDKMSMWHGVEVRVPFLDNELVEFASQIPPEFKIKRNTTKYLLKRLMESYLPKEVIYRSKTGFGAPVRNWVKHDLNDKILEYLSTESIKRRGIFNPVKISQLIKNNKAGKIDASHSIWALLAIESWMRQFVDE